MLIMLSTSLAHPTGVSRAASLSVRHTSSGATPGTFRTISRLQCNGLSMPTSSWVPRPSILSRPQRLLRLCASSAVGEQPNRTDSQRHVSGKRSIILPVDNSEDSDYAVSWALNHIYRAGDCLHLLHCIPPYHDQKAFSDGEGPVAQRHSAAVDAVRQRFEDKLLACNVPKQDLMYDVLEEQHATASFFGVEDTPPLESNEKKPNTEFETARMPGDAIVELAEKFDAAAVVMASHSKNPLAELFHGSVTNFCLHNCSKPVVILHNVPHPTNDDPKLRHGSARAVAVAVDDSELSEKSLQWTIDNIYRKGDKLHVMHVVPTLGGDVAVADGFGDSFEELKGTQASTSQAEVSSKYRGMLEAANVVYEIDLVQEHRTDSMKADSVRLGSALVSKVIPSFLS
mmetsp:Transcript_3120/g.8875  ORF Transcript_3120/g.8875 Transcript_3120/m.8875 type:complete len:399 (-) Transcript_3120:798-1994(-)